MQGASSPLCHGAAVSRQLEGGRTVRYGTGPARVRSGPHSLRLPPQVAPARIASHRAHRDVTASLDADGHGEAVGLATHASVSDRPFPFLCRLCVHRWTAIEGQMGQLRDTFAPLISVHHRGAVLLNNPVCPGQHLRQKLWGGEVTTYEVAPSVRANDGGG